MSTQIEIVSRIGHPLNFIPDKEHNLDPVTLPEAGDGNVARGMTNVLDERLVSLTDVDSGTQVETLVQRVHLARAYNLPAVRADQYVIASLFTLAAAREEQGDEPREDLFFPYGDIRVEGRIVGVRGLGRPRFQKIETRAMEAPSLEGYTHLENACPYDIKLFHHETPDAVARDFPPRATLAMPPEPRQFTRTYGEQLDEELTERLKIPVYDVWVTGVNNYEPAEPGTLRIVNPGILTALGNRAFDNGAMVTSDVRDHEGFLLGGRALAIPNSPTIFDGWREANKPLSVD